MNVQPLKNRTILITRARQQAGRLSRELQVLGAHVIEIPAIEIVPPESYAPLDTALRHMQKYDWLIVTSANAVRVLGERMAAVEKSPEEFAHIRCAAIGPATAEALRGLGLPVALVPEKYIAESFAEALRGHVAGASVLLIRAAIARDVIPDELRKVSAKVDVVDAYQTVLPPASVTNMRKIFHPDQSRDSIAKSSDSLPLSALPDAVTFTSSSTVTNFFQLLKNAGIDFLPRQVKAISIGPITSTALREHGWEPAAEADPHNVEGLVQAVISSLSPR
ncbi:MAG: uroporphyrinogen-III synthase [Acidobacterium ailaaui]|nr:uroporphyrinogen-III synthase [Pseudacidobacterium ailaaui]